MQLLNHHWNNCYTKNRKWFWFLLAVRLLFIASSMNKKKPRQSDLEWFDGMMDKFMNFGKLYYAFPRSYFPFEHFFFKS